MNQNKQTNKQTRFISLLEIVAGRERERHQGIVSDAVGEEAL